MIGRFRKASALLATVALVTGGLIAAMAAPAGAATPQPEPCQILGCAIGGGSGTYTPLSGDYELGTSFSPQVPGVMFAACAPDASGEPFTLWTNGSFSTSLGTADVNGCVPLFLGFSAGNTYTVSVESTSGTYLQNSNPGGDTGGSADPNLPYAGAFYNTPGNFPNLVGGGDWQVTIDVYTFPVDAPLVSVSQGNDGTPQVAFTGDGDPFGSFDVTCTSTVGGTFTATGLAQTDSPITVTGMGSDTPLTPPGISPVQYNTVTCSVTEINIGAGPTGTGSAPLAPASGPGCIPSSGTPDAPGNVSAQPEAFPGAAVSWSPVTTDCLVGYLVTPSVGSAKLVTGNATTTVFRSSSFTPGTSVSFTVAAVTGSGPGPASSSVTVTIGTPAKASALKATRMGKGAIKVSFKPGSNNGAAITSFKAQCGSRSASGKSSPIVVKGLTPGKSYTCWVVATNSRGKSVPTHASNSVKA